MELQLEFGEIHLWHAQLATCEELPAILSKDEWARYNSYLCAEAAREFKMSRELLRQVFSNYCPAVSPRDWKFIYNDHGKPRLAENPLGLEFSVSHSYGRLVIAITSGSPIGVDVERPTGDFLTADILSEAEFRDLSAHSFYKFWTLKEAYLKARGSGLCLPLDKISFSFQGENISVSFDREIDDNPARWRFTQFECGEHYTALATLANEQYSLKSFAL